MPRGKSAVDASQMGKEDGMKQCRVDAYFPKTKHGYTADNAKEKVQRSTRIVTSSAVADSVADRVASGAAATTSKRTLEQAEPQRRSARQETRRAALLSPKGKRTGSKSTQVVSPIKAARRSRAANDGPSSKATSRTAAVKYFDRFEFNGDEYKVGDDVYIISTENPNELPNEDVEDQCSICSKSNKSRTMIECDACLGGYHMGCLKPALKKVPDGAWMCPACERGEAITRPLRTSYEVFLFGKNIMDLARITGFARNRNGDGEVEVACRYYCRPQDTYLGRQKHHATREVFLTHTECWEPLEVIFGPATVCRPADFDSCEGTDVFMCEYEYDESWKRFRRREEKKAAAVAKAGKAAVAADDSDDDDDEDSDKEWCGPSSDDEEHDEDNIAKDRNFKPIYAFWAERGMLPGFKARKPSGRATAANKVREGAGEDEGPELVGGLGASVVPSRQPTGPLAQARRALSLSSVPASLPCRDKEKAAVGKFVGDAINEEASSPGVLYICGVPGTGKTATIMEVLAAQRQLAQAKGVQLVTVNALSLPTPQHVYSKLWEKLTGQRCGPSRALAALEHMFSSGGANGGRRCMTLLVVDEIDVLITKDQAVLYNLFEWPMRPGARLAVIGVANTHDLDERVLPRISSRLANSKLAFLAYSKDQLMTIIKGRLQGMDVINNLAIEFAAGKAASGTGDVRRALELLRRAVEISESELRARTPKGQAPPASYTGVVSQAHVSRAIQEMFSAPHMQYLRAACRLEKLLMVALMLEMRGTKRPEAPLQAVHHRMCTHVALLVPEAKVDPHWVTRAAFNLANKKLLLADPAWRGIKAKVSFNVHVDDVSAAIKEDKALLAVHSQLSA